MIQFHGSYDVDGAKAWINQSLSVSARQSVDRLLFGWHEEESGEVAGGQTKLSIFGSLSHPGHTGSGKWSDSVGVISTIQNSGRTRGSRPG